jgi:type I restriction enzyme M protein
VPEGIIFQSGKAYKALRKNLVENGLYAVVSLPSGIFRPYSGVKTSVLIFDKELSSKKSDIAFIKIAADGYDLGSSKRVISQNDLPVALNLLQSWSTGESVESPIVTIVTKEEIAKNGDYNLSGDRYKVGVDHSNNVWPLVKLGDISNSLTPPKKIPSSQIKNFGKYQVIDQSQNLVAGWTDDEDALVTPGRGLLIFGDHTCATKFVTQQFAQGADGIKILDFNNNVLPKYIYYVLQVRPIESDGYKRHFMKFKEREIPLPPLEAQEQIVEVLDGYAAIINGANQMVDNWKPKIDIDIAWKKVRLGDYVDIYNGSTPRKTEGAFWDQGTIPWFTVADIRNQGRIISSTRQKITKKALQETSVKLLPANSVLLCCTASIGEYAFAEIPLTTNQQFNGLVTKDPNILNPKYLFLIVSDFKGELERMSGKSTFGFVSVGALKEFEIPLPSLDIQNTLVDKFDEERLQIEAAVALSSNYQVRTRMVIENLWSPNL